MATLESATQKYARKTAAGAAKWNAAKGRMAANYSKGLAEFGIQVAPEIAASYSAGINAAQYRGGDPNKWRENFVAKMSGR